MTKIGIKLARGLFCGRYELVMEGHAGFNPGNDIVCSALSCLFFSLANYLDGIGAKPFVEYDKDSGYGHILCRGCSGVRFAFEFCAFGFRMLAEMYPDNVCVVENSGP